jgi:putative transcription factor
MCGAKEGIYKAKIEGSLLNVCQGCTKFGKVISAIQPPKLPEKAKHERQILTQSSPAISQNEITEVFVENYHEIIKRRREELNLTQEEFAKKINEKESIIHKLETGSFEPNMVLARKIEKFLKIHLIEQTALSNEDVEKPTKNEEYTLGDFIVVKKR